MHRRTATLLLAGLASSMSPTDTHADGSSGELASYYARHMALLGGVAYGWIDQGAPVRMRSGVRQVGVNQDSYFVLLEDGTLIGWTDAPERSRTLMRGVARFAVGQSGWFAIDPAQVLWKGEHGTAATRRIAEDVVDACIGDSADYYITGIARTADGVLWQWEGSAAARRLSLP